jgi:hypothetical protein
MIINYTSSQEHYNNKCFAAGLIWHYLLFLSTKKKSKNSNALPTICLEVIFDPVINFHPQYTFQTISSFCDLTQHKKKPFVHTTK